MLRLNDIDVFYGPVQALRGVTLEIEEGEMVALIGANGAGKTTTLRAISGMVAPARGEVLFRGSSIGGMPAHKVVRLGVSHMPEGRDLFPELTVTENLRLGHWSRRKERDRVEERIERIFGLFPRLRERATQAAGTMSGGEQQMLTFGRALMTEPSLLLVDELSLGLAPIIVGQLFDVIAEVNKLGTAVLLVEQFVHLALKHSSRAYVLARGEVVAQGSSQSLLQSPEVMAAYLGEAATDTARADTASAPNQAKPASARKKSSAKARR